MIYTTVRKILPGNYIFIEMDTDVSEVNALSNAYYYLFNSKVLTKNDYIHIFKVLAEKVQVYKLNNNLELFNDVTIEYAIYNYPNSKEIRRVLDDYFKAVKNIRYELLEKSIYKFNEIIPESSEFVGIELHARGFNQKELTKEQVESIRNIIVVK